MTIIAQVEALAMPECQRPWMKDPLYSYGLTTAADHPRMKPCKNAARYQWRLWMLDVPLYDAAGERIAFRDREVVEVCRTILACGKCTGLSKRQQARVERGQTVRFNGAAGDIGCMEISAVPALVEALRA